MIILSFDIFHYLIHLIIFLNIIIFIVTGDLNLDSSDDKSLWITSLDC